MLLTWKEVGAYTTVDRSALLYDAETWATTRGQAARLEVNDMRMVKWMCGVTRRSKIRNEHIKGTKGVAQGSKKITEKRLKLYGHVMRMKEEHIHVYYIVRRVRTYQGKEGAAKSSEVER